jgi:iron complex outermembrane receptor protein
MIHGMPNGARLRTPGNARNYPAISLAGAIGLVLGTLACPVLAAEPATEPADSASPETGDNPRLREVVVTAPRMLEPLKVEMDAKVPRQPLPAHDGADYLKSVSGFSVIRKGGTDGDPVFRGMAGSRLSIQTDGEHVLGGCGSRMDPPTAYIFPETYDRIVIVKGPQTVLRGPGNAAATVMFERDDPRYQDFGFRTRGSALTATADRRDFVADVEAGNQQVYGHLSASRAESGNYEDGAGREVHSRYMRWNANGLMGWTPTENSRFTISGAKSDGEAAYADRSMDGSMFARENVGMGFELDRPGQRISKVEAQAFYNYVDHVMDNYSLREFIPSMMAPNPSASNPDRRTSGARASFDIGGDASNATFGVDMQENVHTGRSTSNQNGDPYQRKARVEDARFRNVGLFGEASWRVADDQKIVAGARVDSWYARDYRATRAGNQPNPTFREERDETLTSGFARYERDVTSLSTTFYAGVGHVERFPDYWEITGSSESTTSLSAFNAGAEKTTQLDTGFIFRSKRLELALAGFYNQVDDFILMQSAFMKGMRSTTVTRSVDATTYGAELDLAYQLSEGWNLTGAAAYTRGTNDTDDRPLAQIPALELRAGVNYEADRWSAGMLVRSVADQERFSVNQGNIVGKDLGRTDGFTTVAASASWKLTDSLLLSTGVDNLFDREYAEHLSRGGAALSGYEQTMRINEPGRTAWLRIGADFK